MCEAGVVRVTLSLEAGGYGALLLADSLGPELDAFLATMAEMTARPLGAYSSEWEPLQQARHINNGGDFPPFYLLLRNNYRQIPCYYLVPADHGGSRQLRVGRAAEAGGGDPAPAGNCGRGGGYVGQRRYTLYNDKIW